LSQSTHLFGRRLVLEWAEPEQSQDVEILRQREEALNGTEFIVFFECFPFFLFSIYVNILSTDLKAAQKVKDSR